jgi:hypothetical protein
MMKHSEGPWNISPHRSKKGFYAKINAPNGDWYEFAKVVVRVKGDPAEHPTGLANARLIAAAPDMIDVLMQWQAAERDGSDDELRNARNNRDEIIAMLRGEADSVTAKDYEAAT